MHPDYRLISESIHLVVPTRFEESSCSNFCSWCRRVKAKATECHAAQPISLAPFATAYIAGHFSVLTRCSAHRGTNSGAIWSVHMQPGGDLAFYAGDSGEVGMFRIARGDRYVSADAHQCFAGLPRPCTHELLALYSGP